ncbi:MAG: GNAT family N-acetyltransferase [Oscillatoriales cyanobacterium RM1_1_9]|nr:GNAT family N-acetyltransferase [Oscillatoriales cyanobacterium SM2_3_0]NJO44692.1 GNAT family N-acetyltransferase [Oscillatoriales cyanobacterium RM2_1_1]NJO71845.1 GNAT family N-acetyltransferase [Oscillatoriales cyanobacterium RM1_1_9]
MSPQNPTIQTRIFENLAVRPANLQDVAKLVEFNCAIAQETENKILVPEQVTSGIKTLIENPHFGFYLVAEKNQTVIGCLMITSEWSDWRNGLFWWIQSVYVKPNFRRQGVFKSLYQYVQSLAQENPQICGLRLYVEQENQVAQKTYHSLGMEKTPYQILESIKPEFQDAIPS